jgi:hypothetical protein
VQQLEADSKIEEEYLFNFVVNSLNGKLAIAPGENVEVTTETSHEVLVGASSPATPTLHRRTSPSV